MTSFSSEELELELEYHTESDFNELNYYNNKITAVIGESNLINDNPIVINNVNNNAHVVNDNLESVLNTPFSTSSNNFIYQSPMVENIFFNHTPFYSNYNSSEDYDADDEYEEENELEDTEGYFIASISDDNNDDDFESIDMDDLSPFISPLGSDDSGYRSFEINIINNDSS